MSDLTTKPGVQAALKEFDAAQAKYAKFGAWDTEPTSVMYCLLDDLEWNGNCGPVPTTIKGWQLFSGMKGAGAAAKALNKAAKKVVAEAKKAQKAEKASSAW